MQPEISGRFRQAIRNFGSRVRGLPPSQEEIVVLEMAQFSILGESKRNNEKELAAMPRTGLKKWPEIASRYTDGLLLGNGASMALSGNFRYTDLLGYARRLGLITPEIGSLFEHLDTTDFELVLRMVWQAHELNQLLKIDEPKTANAYKALQTALIRVVRDAHPEYAEIEPRLASFSELLRHFDTIVSLNYDLLLYWAHMYSNTMVPTVSLKDCFIDGAFRRDWRTLRQPYPGTSKSILVFYPHGNLNLAESPDKIERKITVGTSIDLLSQIESRWRDDQWQPRFVSEGTSKEKRTTILNSAYLSTVFEEVLPSIGASLAVFGWSFGEADDHILSQLLRGSLKRIAVAVHAANPHWRDFRDGLRRRLQRATKPAHRPKLEFFDAASMPLAGPAPNPAPGVP